jgi:hypothetical protein
MKKRVLFLVTLLFVLFTVNSLFAKDDIGALSALRYQVSDTTMVIFGIEDSISHVIEFKTGYLVATYIAVDADWVKLDRQFIKSETFDMDMKPINAICVLQYVPIVKEDEEKQ